MRVDLVRATACLPDSSRSRVVATGLFDDSSGEGWASIAHAARGILARARYGYRPRGVIAGLIQLPVAGAVIDIPRRSRQPQSVTTLIDDFVRRYVRQQDYYAKVAELCGRRVEQLLREANIRSITSWRAKRPDRLRRKLHERHAKRVQRGLASYASESDLDDDIHDLAGARVALYFPSDRETVRELVERGFLLLGPSRRFPVPEADEDEDVRRRRERKRFRGYHAEHFRVQLRETDLGPEEKRFADGRCEIQVASVLMHAWSEVEHDLEYKNLSGDVSDTESALLDQINGLVMAGEIALEQLRNATYERSSGEGGASRIRDQYDLANWLASTVDARRATEERPRIGRADIAFRFLERLGVLAGPPLATLRQRFTDADESALDQPLAERLVELLLSDDPARQQVLHQARADVQAAENLTVAQDRDDETAEALALGEFVTRWRALEKVVTALDGKSAKAATNIVERLNRRIDLPLDVQNELRGLQKMRSRALHSTDDPPDADTLLLVTRRLEDVLGMLPTWARDQQDANEVRRVVAPFESDQPRDPSASIVVDAGPAIGVQNRQGVVTLVRIRNLSDQPDLVTSLRLQTGTGEVWASEPPPDVSTGNRPYLVIDAPIELAATDTVVGLVYFGAHVPGDGRVSVVTTFQRHRPVSVRIRVVA